MVRAWNPNPGSVDYWRSDNPTVQVLKLFGDDEPPPPVGGSPWHTMRKNSALAKWHDTDGTTGFSTNFETNIGVATTGLAPSQNFGDGTGHPTTSDSGLIFNGSNWVAGSHGRGFGIAVHDYMSERGTGTTQGGMGTWSFANMSGMSICGWAQIAPTSTNTTTYRLICGLRRTFNLNQGGWGVWIRPSDMSLRFSWVQATSTVITVDTAGNPNNPVPGQPFFFACSIHRGRQNEQGMAYNTCAGSGEMRIIFGTHQSGMIDAAQHQIGPAANICGLGLQTAHYISFGSVGLQVDGGNANNHVPPDSVLDSIAVMNDAPSVSGFEVLRLNGWNHVPEECDVEHSSFKPINPSTEDLLGYWDWTDGFISKGQDPFVLENKAPTTSGILPLDFVAPRQGGGLGAGVSSNFSPATPPIPFSDTRITPNLNGGGGQITGVTNTNVGVYIPAGSGVNHIFPEVKPGKEGWTWLYWGRSICNFIFGVGTCHDARDIGWQHRTVVDASHKFVENLGEGGTLNPSYYNCAYGGSGVHTACRWFFPLNGTGSQNLRRTLRDEWQFRAVIWDTEAPAAYNLWDGNSYNFMGQRVSPLSGFDKSFHVVSAGDPDVGTSVFRLTHTGPTLSTSQWGPVGIWNRVLSIAEISGFAVSGIETPPIVSPISTDFKQTLGYWKLDTTTEYDPEGVSGVRFDDESWYRHHLTNISGGFTLSDDKLNARIANGSLQVDVSGSMVSLERVFTGSNLDFSTLQDMGPSGFSAGCWFQIPSGDIGTQGNGSSGLFGEHMFMGNWSQDVNNQSWFLGLNDGFIEGRVRLGDGTLQLVTTTATPIFNEPFFIGIDMQPSGSAQTARIVYSEDNTDNSLEFLAEVGSFGTAQSILNSVGASGFSLCNIPNKQAGFPSGTLISNVFVYAGAPNEIDWVGIKKAGVNLTTLGSGSVSVTDPSNISHWKFDFAGSRFLDRGLEQNTVFPINQDGNQGGVIGAIHGSGVVIRETEYYDTLPFNANSRRLDLGSGTQSWTFLTWVLPPTLSNSDEHTIMAKSASLSGIRVFTARDNLQLTANASGAVSRGQNGNIAPEQWNHIAIVYDRDNNEFTTIINGRYAGATFDPLPEVPVNNSGMALGGRGSQVLNPIQGGSAFSGYLDDTMLFSRALTLPEISGLAANSYNYDEGLQTFGPAGFGGYISGLPLFVISGLIGSFMHGQAQDLELVAGYVSGVSGLCIPYGGFMHGKAQVSGAPAFGHFLWGKDQASGVFGHFVHGLDIVSGFIGHYEFGACESNGEFDVVLNFSVVTNKDFDARLGVEKTQMLDFDSRLGVVRITRPPDCTIEAPLIGEVGSGNPFTLTVQGSGIANDGKKIAMTRFTFADFKGAESGTLVGGLPNSGLFEAERTFDTPGWYTIKIEVLDDFGYRSSCCRPFLLLPSGSTSGAFINSLPGIELSVGSKTGSTINTSNFTHSISGLDTISGILEYTDFADQQESLVTSLEMPLGTQFIDFVRRHDYTMPGRYCPVWSVSGEFGIVSDTIADGIDYLV